MKKEVAKILEKRGYSQAFTERNYKMVKLFMKLSKQQDPWLKMFFDLDPINKINWIADYMIRAYRILELGETSEQINRTILKEIRES